jgi:BirA family biotin operon repressor/biotin-[acetyl-CoA-carboxylase] ligase
MPSSSLKNNIITFAELTSTNDYLKTNYQSLVDLTVVRAGYQTHGRGQFERVWHANHNENLLCSFLLKDNEWCKQEDINPVVVSALISMLKEYEIEASFKYPNDIYVGSKKIAGVLIETKYSNDELTYLIVGVGLNINQKQFNEVNAVSMVQLMHTQFNIVEVFHTLLKYLDHNLSLLKLLKEKQDDH